MDVEGGDIREDIGTSEHKVSMWRRAVHQQPYCIGTAVHQYLYCIRTAVHQYMYCRTDLLSSYCHPLDQGCGWDGGTPLQELVVQELEGVVRVPGVERKAEAAG